MGYYTDFQIDVSHEFSDDTERDMFGQAFKQVTGYELYTEFDGTFSLTGAKWYDFAIDMKTLSRKYPDRLFTLSGRGEDRDDVWIAYFMNDKAQMCRGRIEFDPFDEDRMK